MLPELLEESQPKQSFLQLLFILAGIAATASVSLIVEWQPNSSPDSQSLNQYEVFHNLHRAYRKENKLGYLFLSSQYKCLGDPSFFMYMLCLKSEIHSLYKCYVLFGDHIFQGIFCLYVCISHIHVRTFNYRGLSTIMKVELSKSESSVDNQLR